MTSTCPTPPLELAPRFAGAPRAVVFTRSGSFELVVAEGFALRLRGLAGLEASEVVPLLLPRCRSVHTFGMRTPIDIVWLSLGPDGAAAVLAVAADVRGRRLARAPRAGRREHIAALEVGSGDAEALGLRPGGRTLISR